MGKYFKRFVVLLLLAFVGVGILGSGEGYAGGGGFEVPQVNDHFDQVKPGPAPKKTEPMTQNAKEESGTWDWITKPVSGAWEWTKEKVSSAWEWTKETASSIWDWFVGILAKITEVVVDALSAAWDWIVKYKEYVAFAGVLILGIVLCFLAPPLGVSVLSGVALSFVISVALNGGKIDKTAFMDAAIGGLLGLFGAGIAGGLSRGLATGFGQKLITGLTNSKVLGPILQGGGKLISKLPGPLQKIFTKAGFISAVEGVGTSITDDLLRGRKINWKMALLSGVFGAGMVGVVAFAKPVIDKATASIKPILAKIPIVKNLDDCFAYNQTPGYFALADGPFNKILPKCLYSPDGEGKGSANSKGTGSGLLSSDGKFKDPTLESAYEKYLERKAKEGKPPRDRLEWKEVRDYWLNDSPMAGGNAFNKKAVKEEWYPYNEVHLSNGKRLDSYDPTKGEIVSRKATDLDMIDIATFEKYLKEMKSKYEPGTKIRSNKYRELDGQELEGKQILEIPASIRSFSQIQDYINLAKDKYGIEIRFREE